MSGSGCSCDRCNNCDDPYADEHKEECCCEDCHENHDYIECQNFCEYCRDQIEESQKENSNGSDQQQKS